MADGSQAIKAKMGRPTAFKPEYIEQVERLCRLGVTEEEMADFFNVSIQTIYNWREKHQDFLEAIKRGKMGADMEVAQSLHDKAKAGDVTAQIFWLKNRRSLGWRDRKDVDITATVKHSVEELSDDDLAAIARRSGNGIAETTQGKTKPN